MTVWAPRSMGLSALWNVGLEESFAENGLRAVLEEAELAFADIEPTLREQIASGTLAADFVMVPWGIGRRLLADGLLEEPHTELFSSEDPEQAALMFGIIVAAPANASTMPATRTRSTGVEFENGCLTAASRERVLGTASRSDHVAIRFDESAPETDWELVDGAADAMADEFLKEILKKLEEQIKGATKSEYKDIIKSAVDEIVKKIQEHKGANAISKSAARRLALRVLTKAFIALDIVTVLKDIVDLTHASYEVGNAVDGAYRSAMDTYSAAVEAVGREHGDLIDIERGILLCDLSGEDALVALDASSETVRNYQDVGLTALNEMADLRGSEFGPSLELLDNVVARYLERWTEARAAARAKIASRSDDDLLATAEELIEDDPMTPEPDWETFAELLTGLDADNPFTHSNGMLMTTASGSTDLLRSGSARAAVSLMSRDHLFGGPGLPAPRFPCGEGPVATTLCGSETFPAGEVILVAATFAADVPASDATYHYQYGFVFDADADPTNDYQASIAYPKDLFDDTDRWWEVLHDASSDSWTLQSTLARDGSLSAQTTAARAIVNGKSIVLVIPAAELESESPPFRTTAFRHTGDYGINPPHDFNGDVHPLVGDPLATASPMIFTAADGM